jgi:hypothetical protein
MIGGYPHDKGSMLEVACSSIEKQILRTVSSTVVSLGGFSAPRAEKFLRQKVLGLNPHYVVIQFASTDAQCPVRKSNRPASSSSQRSAFSYHRRPVTMLSLLRWEIITLIGRLRKLTPINPLPSHIAAIMRMTAECKSAGITPVVLSPFLYGSRYTTANAFSYVKAVHDLAEAEGFLFVDCMRVLRARPKREILQHDGFHLSEIGQEMVGQAIADLIVRHEKSKKTEQSRFPTPQLLG